MSRALLFSMTRERLTRPAVLVLVALVLVVSLAIAATEGEQKEVGPLFAMIFGAGCIGRSVSSGALGLLLTRPIERWRYVLTVWVSVGGSALLASLLALGVQVAVLAVRGTPLPAQAVWEAVFADATGAFGIAATLVLLSALLPGFADIAAFFALSVVFGLAPEAGLPQRFADLVKDTLIPTLGWSDTFGPRPIALYDLTTYVSSVLLHLTLAIALMNRKEISYASG